MSNHPTAAEIHERLTIQSERLKRLEEKKTAIQSEIDAVLTDIRQLDDLVRSQEKTA